MSALETFNATRRAIEERARTDPSFTALFFRTTICQRMYRGAARQLSRSFVSHRKRLGSGALGDAASLTARTAQKTEATMSKRKMEESSEGDEEMQIFKVVKRVGQEDKPGESISNVEGPSTSRG